MEEHTELAEVGEGQAGLGPEGATEAAPRAAGEQSGGTAEASGATGSDGPQDTGDILYDPQEYQRLLSELPDENLKKQVEAFAKGLQGDYTRKSQALKENRQKIEAYDQFNADPVGYMQRLAQQYGYRLTPAQAAQAAKEMQGQTNDPGIDPDWQPKTWQEVFERSEQMTRQKLLKEFEPVLQEVQNMRRTSIERQLSEIDPTWQQYEDRMRENLQKHPSLSKDPAMLYRMSVPQQVLESRATQRAIAKLESKGKAAQVAGGSTSKRSHDVDMDKVESFADAVAAAKKKLERDPEMAQHVPRR